MVVNIDNGYVLDLRAIKNILMTIYESKPQFPIDDTESLVNALGGRNKLLFINEHIGELPSIKVAEKIFEKLIDIKEPNQIIDGIIGQPFVDIITKFKLLDTIYNLTLPIENKDEFFSQTKNLIIYGIPIEILAEKLDYPIEKHDQIINRIKLMDKKLLETNVDLIANIKESEDVEEGSLLEEHGDTLEEISVSLQDKEMSLKQKIKLIIEHGKNAYREQNFQKALDIYDKGLEIDHDNTELKFLRKSMQQKLEDLGETVSEPIHSEQESPKDVEEISYESFEQTVVEPGTDEMSEETVEKDEIDEAQPTEIDTELEGEKDIEIELKEEVESQSTDLTLDDNLKEDEHTKEDLNILKSAEMEFEAKGDDKEVGEKLSGEDEDTNFNKFEMDSKIEELGKRLQEKVSLLKNLSTKKEDLPENACKSCEGNGNCYWCKGSGKCKTCSGTGKDESGNDCSDCNGSGECHSCKGVGKCHWCNGSGEKAS
jgi:hypothetical protein